MTFQGPDRRPERRKVAALVVTYFPDADLPERLDKLLEQVGRLVIVDNGSDNASLFWVERYSGRAGVTILRNSTNLGIATALNQGMRLLESEGHEWVFTTDQDSTVTEGCIQALLETLVNDRNPGDIALVGSNRCDAGTGASEHRWMRPKRGFPFFERVTCDQTGPSGVMLVITSGTLTSVQAFGRLGPFREEFFIDFVDIEYCLRACKSGYRILVSCRAKILHRVGAKKQVKLFGVTLSPMHHSPLRKYYLFRNAVMVIRSYGRTFPNWLIFQLLALLEVITGILFFESHKGAKLKACMAGIWDGLHGRLGRARREF